MVVPIRYSLSGSGPWVVLIHGYVGSAYNWRFTVPDLARDHTVLALDLPGAGLSGVPARGLRFSDMADLTAALLEELGAPPAAVVGHSMGGEVAVDLALRHPDRVERLVLTASTGLTVRPFSCGFEQAAPEVLRRLGRPAAVRPTALEGLAAAAADFRWALPRARHLSMRRPEGCNAFVESLAQLVDRGLPIGILWGSADPLVPAEDAEAMSRLAKGAPFEVIPGAGHLPMYEAAQAYNAALRRLLTEIGALAMLDAAL